MDSTEHYGTDYVDPDKNLYKNPHINIDSPYSFSSLCKIVWCTHLHTVFMVPAVTWVRPKE